MKMLSHRLPFVALTALICAACATQTAEEREIRKVTNEALNWAASLEKERRVNDNWSAYCTVDNVTTLRRCYAGTFGQNMGYDGNPYGSKSIPFQVYFLNDSGPYVMVGYHTFPGRTPTVRIDNNDPVEIRDNAGVTAPGPSPILVKQMLAGKVAKARYHVWPRGSEDMYIDLSGFGQAWERLNVIRKQ